MKTYTIAFSPCPNDTFIFDALVHQKIDTKGLRFEYVMDDVETLNAWALEEKYDISKISYATLPYLWKKYLLLNSGSALGRGVGPLLLAKNAVSSDTEMASLINNAMIAIPGKYTTANFLLSAAFPDAKNKEVVLFSDIEAGIISEKYELGLVIHESRFTYQEKGLHCLMDMGKWWEATTQLPIPLGGIVIKNAIPHEDALLIEHLISQSIAYSWAEYPQLSAFVTDNAQEMSEEVMRQHIQLYVNAQSEALDEEAKNAISKMLEFAKRAGWAEEDAVIPWLS